MGPSFDETVKWIQSHISEAGFPAQTTSDNKHGLVFTYAEAPYSVHFDGCVMQLSLSEHWHSKDTSPVSRDDQTDTDSYMNMKLNLPLDKLVSADSGVLQPQDWEMPDIDSGYSSRTLPTVAIVLPQGGAGTTTYSWSTTDETYTQKSIVFTDKPITSGAFVVTQTNGFGYRMQKDGIEISYARPGTEESPAHMAKALNHLIELCKQNPQQGTKDIF